jgi:hypothetical protein
MREMSGEVVSGMLPAAEEKHEPGTRKINVRPREERATRGNRASLAHTKHSSWTKQGEEQEEEIRCADFAGRSQGGPHASKHEPPPGLDKHTAGEAAVFLPQLIGGDLVSTLKRGSCRTRLLRDYRRSERTATSLAAEPVAKCATPTFLCVKLIREHSLCASPLSV